MLDKEKKHVKVYGILAFLIFFCVTFVLLSYLMRPISSSRKNICGFYAEEDNSLDVVYVGGSACYAYWEPLKAWNDYGFTSYNFALDSLQPQVIHYILQEVLMTQSPELFIIDARPFQYGGLFSKVDNMINMNRVAPFRNLADNMKYSTNRAKMIHEVAPSQEEEWTYQLDIAKYHSNLYAFLNMDNWKYILNERESYTKGFIYQQETDPILFTDTGSVTEELQLSSEVDTVFIDLLEYCKKENLNVLFIVHAYGNAVEDQQKYNYIERRIDEYGFDFLNVNDYFDEIGFDTSTDFKDQDHVNLFGAEKYSTFLAQYLNDNYSFQDKRDNLEYAQWHANYNRWSVECESIKESMQNGNVD